MKKIVLFNPGCPITWFISPLFVMLLTGACHPDPRENKLNLWYDKPAEGWTEALPVGNGSLGAMVYGGVELEHIQFNEETLWTGAPNDYAHKGAHNYLDEIRQLLFEHQQAKAEALAMKEFMSIPLQQREYQPFGDLYLEFPGHRAVSRYQRELDLENAICRTSYESGEVTYTREVLASHPDRVLAIRLESSKKKALQFRVRLETDHEEHRIKATENGLELQVAVKDGALRGSARLLVETDGRINIVEDALLVTDAGNATLWLAAATNFINFRDVTGDPDENLNEIFRKLEERTFKEVKESHMADYRNLFDRFSIDLGTNRRDSLPTDRRIAMFSESPDDPRLLTLYMQYGRYLLISSSRKGTQPANLQGIWNKDLKPAWGSKYTVNINTEMNYWPAEVTNLSECHEPLFDLIGECAETGRSVAREHYHCEGWVLHHNTDLWRGTAPINHSNHGIWVGGSGWLASHLWEHYLFTKDKVFLRDRAYPVMKGAATFYKEFLSTDPRTGWLISTPSNSPENGGLVAGPTMDHQIIRSLLHACMEAADILGTDQSFAAELDSIAAKIAPNQIGQYGQLQEWLEDLDDPENRHRHVSHLWGMHPGTDINWEQSPDLMEAARQSLIFRGDEGTGWSLAWKINFWARLREGDHAYKLIQMVFRPVATGQTSYSGGGGSYANLFDAHPPFQIDGNFGATAGMVEMLIQSHLSTIDLLPALPTVLPKGSISGVCARGGFELAFSWEDGALVQVEVLSKAGENCRLRYGDRNVEFETSPGAVYILDGNLQKI